MEIRAAAQPAVAFRANTFGWCHGIMITGIPGFYRPFSAYFIARQLE